MERTMRNQKYVILAVDDDRDVTDVVATILEANGYIVETANSGAEGLAKYDECSPDFVLVDMMMETMGTGLDLAKALKQRGDKPVFLLSSAADSLAQVADPRSQGLDGMFQKPLDPKMLLRVLASQLGRD
jgi:CheY-like chemotaxis protein